MVCESSRINETVKTLSTVLGTQDKLASVSGYFELRMLGRYDDLE